LELAGRLQEAGALVAYGVVGYKTHAKMLLILRREGKKLVRYIHLGTGNYHSKTTRFYTDYSLLSANPIIAEDVHRVFRQLTGMGQTEKMEKILNAPFNLKQKLIELIEGEVKYGNNGHIILKANGITEPSIIQALYRASQVGVKIELIIRGTCCLRPGVKGVSETITVRSILGRFLEHARVYFFKHAEPSLFCASADLMERNLDRRVETGFPIEDPSIKERVLNELQLYLNDDWQSWSLQSDGSYIQNRGVEATAAQLLLAALP
jgi:polyphosphate kinase